MKQNVNGWLCINGISSRSLQQVVHCIFIPQAVSTFFPSVEVSSHWLAPRICYDVINSDAVIGNGNGNSKVNSDMPTIVTSPYFVKKYWFTSKPFDAKRHSSWELRRLTCSRSFHCANTGAKHGIADRSCKMATLALSNYFVIDDVPLERVMMRSNWCTHRGPWR